MENYCLNFRNPLSGKTSSKKMEDGAKVFESDEFTYLTSKEQHLGMSSPKSNFSYELQEAFSAFSDNRNLPQLPEMQHEVIDLSGTNNVYRKQMLKGSRIRPLKKNDDEECTKIGCIIEQSNQTAVSHLETPEFSALEDQKQSRKNSKQLRKELQRSSRLLHCERSQKNALKERLDHVEAQFEDLRRSLAEGKLNNDPQTAKIKKLKEKLQVYQKELEEAKAKGDKLQEEMNGLRKENKKLKEKMNLLMFAHIPCKSPRFKDLGAVNYEVKESLGNVGRYKLGKKLGEGHYGTVQVGTNSSTKKKYAVKVLKKDRIARFKDLQQVAMEVHVLKNYPHQNIVHLSEVIHAPENIYIITELCMMDLHKYHNEIGLTEDGAKHVIFGILKPLQFLHSHGICHLDLKPENILLDQSADLDNLTHENVRLCDFGLVNMAAKPEQTQEIIRKGYACGTPGFFAPEMILMNEFEGRTADMWSLGCIILEVTLGFTREWIESYERIEPEPKEFENGLENCLNEIAIERYPMHQNLLGMIHQCLSINPANRINSTEALAHPWLQGVGTLDEHRQDLGHSRHRAIDKTSIYAERTKLVESAVLC